MPSETREKLAKGLEMLRPGAAWRRCDDYQALTETWEAAAPLPTEAEILAAAEAYEVEEEAERRQEEAERAGAALLPRLRKLFAAELGPPEQIAFATAFGTVRSLLEAGAVDLAKGHLASLDIPEDLEEARGRMLALFPAAQ